MLESEPMSEINRIQEDKQESKPEKQFKVLSKTSTKQKKTNTSFIQKSRSETIKDFFRVESKDMNYKNIKSF